jgi:hypothetical protein
MVSSRGSVGQCSRPDVSPRHAVYPVATLDIDLHHRSLGSRNSPFGAASTDEEVLFRGLLQPRLVRWLGVWLGLPASALLFALAHERASLRHFFGILVS